MCKTLGSGFPAAFFCQPTSCYHRCKHSRGRPPRQPIYQRHSPPPPQPYHAPGHRARTNIICPCIPSNTGQAPACIPAPRPLHPPDHRGFAASHTYRNPAQARLAAHFLLAPSTMPRSGPTCHVRQPSALILRSWNSAYLSVLFSLSPLASCSLLGQGSRPSLLPPALGPHQVGSKSRRTLFAARKACSGCCRGSRAVDSPTAAGSPFFLLRHLG